MNRFLLVWFCSVGCCAAVDPPTLVQNPTLNKTHIVFSYAGDLWRVPREGGDAVHLTSGVGQETAPIFSPDGSTVAFEGEYDGNKDVYLIPANGGVPKRLTHHPGEDIPVGWSVDGKQVLFASVRDNYEPLFRLYTVPVDGGFPTRVDLPMAAAGSFSPDGTHLAYMPLSPAFLTWKRYRGGRTTPIWIADLADGKIVKVPRDNSNDFNPMWIDKRIYFLSDRGGTITLFYYDLSANKVVQAIRNDGFDIKSASAGPGAIVYEQFGSLHLYNLKTGQTKPVPVRISGDIQTLRPRFERVSDAIQHARISPSGARAVLEARGEILTVPAEKGDIRNLTNTPGVAERDPSWSPDGARIAYFSDQSGEYELHLRAQTGRGDVDKIRLGDPPAFYYHPFWSPDSKKIAYTNQRHELWYVDPGTKIPMKVDTDTYQAPSIHLFPDWSPDSKWIAYTKLLKNHLRALYLYSLETGTSHQISDGMSDAEFAKFDKDGRYLYFTASTNLGLTTAWLDMSSYGHEVSRNVYVVVLRKDDPSPIAPESDDERLAADKDKDKASNKESEKKEPSTDGKAKSVDVRIDLEKIDQRILALPIPGRDYVAMAAGKAGILFLTEVGRETGLGPDGAQGPMPTTIYKFDLKTRKTEKFADGVRSSFEVSQNGEKVLFRQGANWIITGTAAPPKPGEGTLKLDAMEVRVDPQEEWMQIYREVWRIERDFFYDPNLHGVNAKAAEKKYKPYAQSVASRQDLNYVFQEMLGELTVGHLRAGGGSSEQPKKVLTGLLGADYKIENGRYRFARIYNGENWNPQLKAPLTQPGVNVVAGQYLLAVNGRDLSPPANVYGAFESTAGKSVMIRVGPNPDGTGSREVTVVPIPDELALRNLAWIEENRRKVDLLSGGRLAYVYLPDTAGGGFTNFNRYYFAQIGKEGAVIDERFNRGGSIAEYIVENLKRPLTNFFSTRYGEAFTTPQNQIFGPKAMIINEYAGSGGDAMPWLFRQRQVGPLIGKRTWGGLVGIFAFPPLIDGGSVTAPNLAFWNLQGEWDVENHGVAPDIEVEYDPALVRAGHDPQLEKAVEVLMAELKNHPLPTYKKPPFPNYHKEATDTGSGK